MDSFANQLERIRQRFSELSAGRKIFGLITFAALVACLFWWSSRNGSSNLEPVLNQPFAEEDLARVTAQLASKNIQYKVVGDRVLVPPERRFEVLSDLSYAQLLPRNTEDGFDSIIKQMSPWASPGERDALYNHAKETTLSQVIANFPNVNNAVVIIDPTSRRSLDREIEPSATVNITMRRGTNATNQLVEAAADVVAGAQSGLSRSKINVVVDGTSHRARDGAAGGLEHLELVQQYEDRYIDKIKDHLSYIPGLMVSVTVNVNAQSTEQETSEVDRDKTFAHQTSTETHRSAPDAIAPNTQMKVPDGSDESMVQKAEFEVFPSTVHTKTLMPAGEATVVGASIRVPRSYFVGILKNGNPSAKEPASAEVKALIEEQLPSIRDAVKLCIGIKSEADISIDTYADVLPLVAPVVAHAPVQASAPGGSYSKEIAFVAIAAISLFIALFVVRKRKTAVIAGTTSTPMFQPESFRTHRPASVYVADDDLEQETAEAQEMLDEVSNLVRESPDDAAKLVSQWLKRS